MILTLSILPDIDLLIPLLKHGGPAHSIILYAVIAFPAILLWKKQTIPYLLAIALHPLLGDYLTRPIGSQGVQLLYPLSSKWFSAGSYALELTYVYVEAALFASLMILMLVTRDVETLIKPHPSNMLLAVPISTALLPALISFPIPMPPELIIPHLILILFLALPILIDISHVMHNHGF